MRVCETGRPLSRRQREVFHLLLNGSTNREIAGVLGIRNETVKTYVSQVLAAFVVRDRVELLSLALIQTRTIMKDLADRIERPIVISDEVGAICLVNDTAVGFGLGCGLLPTDLRQAMCLRHRRTGILSIRAIKFDSHESGRHLQWSVENAWINGRSAMFLWRVDIFDPVR